jgi:GH24 family phage-related lysozyme (muramidase)
MKDKDLQGYYVKGETKKTYGYGLRSHPNGQDMEKVKSVYTQNELEQLFKQKIANETNWVLKWANENNVTLGQGQLDAFVSAVYNYGRTGFLRTGIPAMIAENPDNPKIAETWSHLADARAAKYPGLVDRRQMEAEWYDSDTEKA